MSKTHSETLLEESVISDKRPEGLIEDPKARLDPLDLVSSADNLTLWQTIRTYPRATFYCAFAAFGAISDGYQYALPGSIVALPGFIHQFGSPNAAGRYALDKQHVALWGAFYTIGYIIILIAGTWPSDRFGRRWMLLLIQVLMALACLTEMFATSWGHWAIAKVLNGLSVGLNQMTLMTYISEICPSQARGAMLANYSIWWSIGKFLCAIALQILNGEDPSIWRSGVQRVDLHRSGYLAIMVWLVVPESPRWHCERGLHEEAKRILKKINSGVAGYDMEREYAIIVQEVEDGRRLSDASKKINLLSCFRGTNLRRTYISFMPFAWQQWGGNAVINTYTAYFFQLAGLSDPFIASVIISLITIVDTWIAPYITEKTGRRRAIMWAAPVMVVTLFLLGGLLRVTFLMGTFGLGVALITIACIWELFYGSTLGVIAYVYLGETSTLLLRAKTTGVAACGTGVLNLVVNYCTPLMLADPKFGTSATMLFYGGTCTVWTVIAYFTLPETRGRTFLELDELFERRIPARDFAKTRTEADLARQEQRGGI